MRWAAALARDMAKEGRGARRLADAMPTQPGAACWLRRAAPPLAAVAVALPYVLLAPPSADLPAVLLRIKLFDSAGLALWDNWWYGGHYTLSYSVLLAPLGAALGPQALGALAAVAAAWLFEKLSRGAFGADAWLGASWFAVGVAAQLYSGRIAFVLGCPFGLAGLLAVARGRRTVAGAAGLLCSLSSPVAGAFAALGAIAVAGARALGPHGVARNSRAAEWALLAGALLPIAAIALVFPGTGTEPFALSALAPIPPLACLLAILAGRQRSPLRLGALLYAACCLAAYLIPTPMGGNAARLGALAAGPLLLLTLGSRRRRWLALAAVPLAYLQLQAPVRDALAGAADPSASAAYWRPLVAFLQRQRGQPFRVEIPATAEHWESYYVAEHVPLARGWERQLDTADNPLFYGRDRLSARVYRTWLDALAVRYVALPSAKLDPAAVAEARLIAHGLPYLRLVLRTRRFRVYAVIHPLPLAQGAAVATGFGADRMELFATRAGRALVRMRFSPYAALVRGAGCVSAAGNFVRLWLARPGTVVLGVRFALSRIGASGPRCSRGASRAALSAGSPVAAQARRASSRAPNHVVSAAV